MLSMAQQLQNLTKYFREYSKI